MKSDSQNNEYTHSEIRELLDKWFEASISAEEENRLRMLIDSDVDLPDDIEDDCILFSSLTSVSFEDLQDSDIPTDADSRITEAVEAEIKKSRLLQLPVALLKNLLSMRAAGIAAAITVIIIGFAAFHNFQNEQHRLKGMHLSENRNSKEMQDHLKAGDEIEASESYSIMSKDSILEFNLDVDKNSAPSAPLSKNRKKAGPQINPNRVATEDIESIPENSIDSYQDLSEEEIKLARANYRIITDEDEAEIIIFNIFAIYQGNMMSEFNNISKLDSKYNYEISKIIFPEYMDNNIITANEKDKI